MWINQNYFPIEIKEVRTDLKMCTIRVQFWKFDEYKQKAEIQLTWN